MKFYLISLLYILIFNVSFSANIYLKLPVSEACYSSETDSIPFSWESSSINSLYFIDFSLDSTFTTIITDTTTNNKFKKSLIDLNSSKYFWKIRSNSDTSETKSFTIFNLSNIGNLSYAISAQQGITETNGKVSQWDNLVNSQYNSTQNGISIQPLVSKDLIYKNNMVFFGGNDGETPTRLNLNDFLVSDTNFTFITTYKQTSLIGTNCYLTGGDDLSGIYTGGNFQGGRSLGVRDSMNNRRVSGTVELTFNVSTINYNKLYINTSLKTNIIGSPSVDYLKFNTIGLRPDNINLNFHGYLGDIIIFNEILPDSSRLLVENYLRTKYTPFPDLGSDIDSCDYKTKIGFRKDHGYSQITWSNGQTNQDSITINTSGKYWVTVKSFGISLTDTINIELQNRPIINLKTDTISCINDGLFLTYTSNGSFGYEWSNLAIEDTLFNLSSSNYFISQYDTAKNCLIYSDTINILIDSFSINTSLGPDRSFCLGSQLSFSSLQKGNEPYQYFDWSTGDSLRNILLNITGDTMISIEVKDAYNCIFQDTILASINNTSIPSVSFISDTVCFGSLTSFTSTSVPSGSDIINNYIWSFPDQSMISGQNNASYAHLNNEVFNSTLTVTTDSSCENSLTLPVYLHDLPEVNFNSAILCKNDSILILENSLVSLPDSISQYNWYLNDVFESNTKTPFIAFNNEGVSELKLRTTTKFGCTDSITKQFEVFPELSADFSFKNNCVGDSVMFTDETPSFSVVDWNWNFNGVSNSSLENPGTIFNTVGNKQVSLNIENAIGCKSSITKTVFITPQPIASFNFDKACENDKSLFYSNSIVLNDSVISYNWQIDTLNYSGDSVQHLFSEQSIYITSLNIETASGCKDDTTAFITVNEKPSPNFEFLPDYGTAPLEVEFNNLSSGTNTYNWNFGDGNGLSSDENPTYTYTENGIYNISLTAINSDNCDASIEKEIAVIPSDLDIELSRLEFDIQENTNGSFSIRPKMQIRNLGTRLITNADFVLSLDQDNKIAQQWQQNLAIGSATNYTFDAYYLVSNLDNTKYVCVEAINVNDNTELNFNNNKTCKVLDGIVQFSDPYPNPAENKVQLDIITEDEGFCNLQVFSINGKSMTEKQQIEIKKGYNNIVIRTDTYLSGKYIIMMEYLDKKYTKSFVIK